ncbi:unnamed protein product, partial [Adineta steineri]
MKSQNEDYDYYRALSYNLPKFCSNASWYPNATTFANLSMMGSQPRDIFINTNNTIYVTSQAANKILVWSEGNTIPIKNISGNISSPIGLFVTTAGEIYVDSDNSIGRIDKWTLNSTVGISIMYTCTKCYDIFIDMNNNLYCSMKDSHQVVTKSLDVVSNALTIVAGTGTAGNTSSMLNSPYGIYVNTNFDLYVADYLNNRIQIFQSGQLNGITVAGAASLNRTITLNGPTGIILDADNYLYIVDSNNHRIVGSGPSGFHCLVGCSGSSGSAENQLSYPKMLSFDSYGNMFVTDYSNNRIQKFAILTSLCSETITSTLMNLNTSLNTSQSNILSTITTQSSNIILPLTKNVSYNRPRFNAFPSWDPNGIIFANNSTVGALPMGIFVNTDNTIYVADRGSNEILIWFNNSIGPTQTIQGTFSASISIFVTTNGDIYIDNGQANGQVDKWTLNAIIGDPVMYVSSSCYGLFVDINDTLYCSMFHLHQVITKALHSMSNKTIIVAGTGCSGSTSNMLSGPCGIYVDTNFDLYVADYHNNRIQLFQSEELNSITIAGAGSLDTTITLNEPTGIVLDADNYLYIVDFNNNRIVGSGPNGFRCLVGCSGTSGSASNQLSYPYTLSFDSYGNMFISDYGNNRIQKFILLNNTHDPSYNQPKFCQNASWNPSAITFANSITVGSNPWGILVNTNNTIYVADRTNNEIHIWFNNTIGPTQTIQGNFSEPNSIFVTHNGDIYIDNGAFNHRVDKWILNGNTSVPVMYVNASCYGLVVDTTDTLYCSMFTLHQVVKKWLNDNSSILTITAGIGIAGNTSSMLDGPCGIYVDINLDLYVADYYNNRIQLFQFGQLNGIAVAGAGSLNPTITLNGPTGIILDADSYLFIVDSNNNRIVGSGPNGFRCLVGCSGLSGSASDQLSYPATLSFDSYGNMFVSDYGNNRIQKFILSADSCDETTSTVDPTTTQTQKEHITSTEQITTSKTLITSQSCFPPRITLIPSTSTLSSPIQFRRSQDFYIVSLIELNCNTSISIITQWTITNCTSICSNQIQVDSTIITTSAELYIPARTLVYGIYELKLTVTMVNMSSLTSTLSVYVQITSTGITPNLIQYGTSMITRGTQQDLEFDPGTYSIDYDNNVFNASNWIYEYYCRIYGLYMFPNLQGSLLSIDDMRNDSLNPSCLSNRAGWKFSNSIKSSLTILSNSLQSNRTYQFMVYMENRRNSSLQATGYVLVKVEDTHPQMILISCVIWTLCIPNLEFQLLNPTTQVALFSICNGNCTIIQNITWNIYYGTMNSSLNYTKWITFNQTSSYENICFFGMNISNFTTTNQLFLSNPQINLWRFEVIYTFPSEISSSSLNFIINQPPINGSCSITPLNGTTSSLFDISCPNWFDEDDIKDYSIY